VTTFDPWTVLDKGERDPMALGYNQRGKWCGHKFCTGWMCNRPLGHDGHHVGTDSMGGGMYYITYRDPPDMQLPEGF
jgi:hypothetical protein